VLRVLNIIGAKQRLTPAEKMKRYREKLKKEPEKHVIVKQKDAERKQLSRELERKEESAMSPGEQQKLVFVFASNMGTWTRYYKESQKCILSAPGLEANSLIQ